MVVQNVTGWNELLEGKIIGSAFTLFDTAFVGWFVVIIFFTFIAMLYLKTKNLMLTWTSGFLFAAAYVSTLYVNDAAKYVLFITLALTFTGLMYLMFIKRNPESGV